MGLGIIGWPPSEFWNATPYELVSAYEGLSLKMGWKKQGPLNDEIVAELRTMLDKEAK